MRQMVTQRTRARLIAMAMVFAAAGAFSLLPAAKAQANLGACCAEGACTYASACYDSGACRDNQRCNVAGATSCYWSDGC